jgi:hypothetical protein
MSKLAQPFSSYKRASLQFLLNMQGDKLCDISQRWKSFRSQHDAVRHFRQQNEAGISTFLRDDKFWRNRQIYIHIYFKALEL